MSSTPTEHSVMKEIIRLVRQWEPIMMKMSEVLLTMAELRDRGELVAELATQFISFLARSELETMFTTS